MLCCSSEYKRQKKLIGPILTPLQYFQLVVIHGLTNLYKHNIDYSNVGNIVRSYDFLEGELDSTVIHTNICCITLEPFQIIAHGITI